MFVRRLVKLIPRLRCLYKRGKKSGTALFRFCECFNDDFSETYIIGCGNNLYSCAKYLLIINFVLCMIVIVDNKIAKPATYLLTVRLFLHLPIYYDMILTLGNTKKLGVRNSHEEMINMRKICLIISVHAFSRCSVFTLKTRFIQKQSSDADKKNIVRWCFCQCALVKGVHMT